MAESENYTTSLKHDRATQSYHSPMEQDTGAEERLAVTWAVQGWHSPAPPCWSLSFLPVCAGKHHYTRGDGHEGSSHATSFSASLTKKKNPSRLLGYQPGTRGRSPSAAAKPTAAARTSSAAAETQTRRRVQPAWALRGRQQAVGRQEREVRGWGRVWQG